jgi:6-phosphogluconolactonase (cycloisomerase 2 family)
VLVWDEVKTSLTAMYSVSSLPEGFAKNTAFVGEIVASVDGRNIHAGNRVADDSIAVFDVNRKTGLLEELQFANGRGKDSRHIALDPTQRWLLLAHQIATNWLCWSEIRRQDDCPLPNMPTRSTSQCASSLSSAFERGSRTFVRLQNDEAL